jgi:hypothetical protein
MPKAKRTLEQADSASPPPPPKKAKTAASSSSPAAPKPDHKATQAERQQILRDKTKLADANGTLDPSVARWNATGKKPLRTVDRSEGEARIMMVCCACGDAKPLDPAYFHVHHGGATLATSKVGHESLHNSPSNPCNVCWNAMQAVEIKTVVGWVKNIIRKYQNLSAVWYWKQ